MREAGRIARWTTVVLALTAVYLPQTAAAVKPQPLVILPFDASALEREQQWIGQGVAEIVALGLALHPAFVRVDETRRVARPETWGEAAVAQAARALRVDTAVSGRVIRAGTDLVVQPRLLHLRSAGAESVALEPITVPEGEMLLRLLAPLPGVYARTLKAALTDVEMARMEKAAQPTRSLKAFELYAWAQLAVAAQRRGREGHEQAIDLLARAIEADPGFAVAQHALGIAHQALGNRWKANAQFRAASQLDPGYPEPYKSLGDLLLDSPRRLYDQAIEAYDRAIQLRPFYADAHAGLGDARAAKGDVNGAIGAYMKALTHNPINPRLHVSLGKIYYAEKGLYYESVTAYRKALDLDPGSVEARMGLGEVYEDKGLYKEAIAEYRRVIELDNQHTGALYNLAVVYEKTDPGEAIVHWERYIALAANLPSEKDWVDVARQHLRKLKSRIKK